MSYSSIIFKLHPSDEVDGMSAITIVELYYDDRNQK